jgi:hypothetical protein
VELVVVLKMSDDLNQTGVSADEKPDGRVVVRDGAI